MKGNYNYVAPFYDRLARLIYGSAIVNAQRFLVETISPKSSILIVGGGSGWILEEISKVQSQGLHITYVDASEKMIELASKKDTGGNNVVFVNTVIQDFTTTELFDVVITPFLFDNFSDESAHYVFHRIDCLLRSNARWLFADFEVTKTGRLWQWPLLKIMYLFFKLACNIEADHLPDTNALFYKNNYTAVASKTFFHSFIRASVYQKGMVEGK